MTDHDKKPAAGQGEHKLGQGHQGDKPVASRPPATLQSPPDRGARVGDVDEETAAKNRQAGERAGEQVSAFTPEQLATPAPQLTGSRQMWIIVGPYKNSVLVMPDAEAENAKDNHWAVEMATVSPPFDAANPPDHDHDLTDEDRAKAVEEANAWAAAQNPPPEQPPPEGETFGRRHDDDDDDDETKRRRRR